MGRSVIMTSRFSNKQDTALACFGSVPKLFTSRISPYCAIKKQLALPVIAMNRNGAE